MSKLGIFCKCLHDLFAQAEWFCLTVNQLSNKVIQKKIRQSPVIYITDVKTLASQEAKAL